MITLGFIVIILYTIIILCPSLFSFFKITTPGKKLYSDSASIIISYRNEEENLNNLLNALKDQSYSGDVEFILVDDHSTDSSSDIVSKFHMVRLIKSKRIGKKAAIKEGVQNSVNELLIFSDADCRPESIWISAHLRHIANSYASTGPVLLENSGSGLLHKLQYYDLIFWAYLTWKGITSNTFYLANGGNLSARKSIYTTYLENCSTNSIASGDDVFFMQFLKNNHLKASYLFAPVFTKPQNSWKNLLHQRIRWAKKSRYYTNPHLLLLTVFTAAFYIYLPLMVVFNFNLTMTILWIVTSLITFIIPVIEYKNKINSKRDKTLSINVLDMIFIIPAMLAFNYLIAILSLLPISFRWKKRKYRA